MSKARKLRRTRAWARYFNHYSHIPDARVGGWGPIKFMNLPGRTWSFVRRQRDDYPPLQETYFGSGIYE